LKDVEHKEVRCSGGGVDDSIAWDIVKIALNKMHNGKAGKKMVLVKYIDKENLL
jgi:hypothetical protein